MRCFHSSQARLAIGCFAMITWLAALCEAQEVKEAVRKPAPPEFSVAGGVFTNAVTLELRANSSNAVIRFTIDGSEPGARSRAYSRPLLFTNSVLIKAKSFVPESGPSETISQTYNFLEPGLWNFDSNLPLVIITTFGEEIPHESKVPASVRFIQPTNGRCTITGSADFEGRALINVRGHTSLRYPKHSYHLKIRDDANRPRKASLLGFPRESDWVLYAPYPDKTLMRDVLAFELSRDMGHYATRTRFVEVFVCEGLGRVSRRDYAGVYVLEEKIKRGRNRVDIEKLEPDDDQEPGITGGYIFKKDHADQPERGFANQGGFPNMRGNMNMSRPGFPTGPGGFPASPEGFLPAERGFQGNTDFQLPPGIFAPQPGPLPQNRGVSPPNPQQPPFNRGRVPQNNAEPNGQDIFQQNRMRMFQNQREFQTRDEDTLSSRDAFFTRRGNQFFYVEPQSDEITRAQKNWLKSYLDKFESVLYGPDFRDPTNGYAAYLDADSFIDFHLLIEVTKNIDGFRFSTFFEKDRRGKLKVGPAWDWNLSFGNANGKQGWMPEYWYWPQLDDQQYLWYRRLFEDPDFAQKYVDRWGVLRTNVFAPANILARVDTLAALLAEAQERNFRRWRILGRMVWPNSFVGNSYEEEVIWMKQWIQTRLAWIDHQFLTPPSLALNDGPASDGKLMLSAPQGKIYFTEDGSDPRASGGGISPNARFYTAPILMKENARLFARVRLGNRWSSPTVTSPSAMPAASGSGQ